MRLITKQDYTVGPDDLESLFVSDEEDKETSEVEQDQQETDLDDSDTEDKKNYSKIEGPFLQWDQEEEVNPVTQTISVSKRVLKLKKYEEALKLMKFN